MTVGVGRFLKLAHRHQSGAVLPRLAVALAALILVAVVALAVGLIPGGGHDPEAKHPSRDVPPSSGPGLDLRPPPSAPPVLATATGSPPISVAALRRHLSGVLASPGLGAELAFAVSQLGNPAAHWHYGASAATPASTLKLLTTSAALSVLGPDHRFSTSVVRAASPRRIVLVGGGDPLLVAATPVGRAAVDLYPQPASLQRLAVATATGLRADGVRQVRLAYDDTRFTGPPVNPRWPSTYVPDDVVSPIGALWVDEGRETPGQAARSADPASSAADAFRVQLAKAGISVLGPVTEQAAPRGHAARLARVWSAPLEQIVQHILEESDNEAAEVLLRQVAVAQGRPGSSAAGVAAVRAALVRLGLDVSGATFYDGSGLSRDNVLPASLLLQVLETAAGPSHPELRGVIAGLPVAGFSGSLGYRFEDDGAEDGRGHVRAKTGTLTGVHALAGVSMTRSGQVLAFVAIADEVPESRALEAREDLDRIAAALTTCGCSR